MENHSNGFLNFHLLSSETKKIQTFQYKVLYRVIPCNKWLYNIKIKDSEICEWCNEVDDIVYYFLNVQKSEIFGM